MHTNSGRSTKEREGRETVPGLSTSLLVHVDPVPVPVRGAHDDYDAFLWIFDVFVRLQFFCCCCGIMFRQCMHEDVTVAEETRERGRLSGGEREGERFVFCQM